MHTKQDVKKFLDTQGFIPSKKMGQNFLYDINYQQKIVHAAHVSDVDDVIEIGPGLGAITKHLVKAAHHVVAIELDKRLCEYLTKNIPTTNFDLINNDVLKVDWSTLVEQYKLKKIKVVANLPYSISSKIIASLVGCGLMDEIYILVQKEMAERVCAQVGTKDYNAFSSLLQMYADVETLFKIPPSFFVPAPQVDSVFVKIVCHHNQSINFHAMSDFLRICFSQKRKTLMNNLLQKYPKEQITQNLLNLKISSNIRSESLSSKELIALYESFNH